MPKDPGGMKVRKMTLRPPPRLDTYPLDSRFEEDRECP